MGFKEKENRAKKRFIARTQKMDPVREAQDTTVRHAMEAWEREFDLAQDFTGLSAYGIPRDLILRWVDNPSDPDAKRAMAAQDLAICARFGISKEVLIRAFKKEVDAFCND